MPKASLAIAVLCVLGFPDVVLSPVFGQPPAAAKRPEMTYSVLADTLLARARDEVERVRALVESGTLSRTKLAEAEERLADAQDQDTLARTLYGEVRVENMTDAAARDMQTAAEARVKRQETVVAAKRTLLDSGVLARTEFETVESELDDRRSVLRLVEERVKLMQDLRRMAENERQAEMRAQSGTLRDSMIRYSGTGSFAMGDLPKLSARFAKKFGYPLPVSAVGQTLVHTELGLDHRNRADVALNPESKEGLWLRGLLEQLHVPYLAFRAAVAGAATAPHIHLGTGSTRLQTAGR